MNTCVLSYIMKIKSIVSIFICLATLDVCLAFLVTDGHHRVRTRFGEFVGLLRNVEMDGTNLQVVKFLGVPYAQPPVGDLRLRKPIPITNITDPLYAFKFGPACLQVKYPGILNTEEYSEDCLYLNIYIPSNAGDLGIALKSVMIFVHGGGFFLGFSHSIEPDVLSAYTDTIVVTINYRLGPMGFLSTHDQNAPGNYGLWDQHLAIKWVKDNIHTFGGSPSDMTIFGESAGASSVLFQAMYPKNKGLFSRVIAESGTLAAWGNTPPEINYNRSVEFAASLGCTSDNSSELISCLRSKSSNDIDVAITNSPYSDVTTSPYPTWTPQFDGDFIIAEPETIMKESAELNHTGKYTLFHDLDLMIGANNYDGGVYLGQLLGLVNVSTAVLNVTKQNFKDLFVPYLIKMVRKESPSRQMTEAAIFEYTDWADPNNETRRYERLLDMVTDFALNAPTVTMAMAHTLNNNNRTYVYQFSAAPPKRLLPLPTFLDGNANHADELPFVYGFSDSTKRLLHIGDSEITPDQFKLSRIIMTHWSNFAKSGNPNKPVSLTKEFPGFWPAYGEGNQQYLEFTLNMDNNSVKSKLKPRAVAFWNGLFHSLEELSP